MSKQILRPVGVYCLVKYHKSLGLTSKSDQHQESLSRRGTWTGNCYIYIYIFSAKASSCTHFAAKVSELVYKGNLTRHLGSLGCWKWQWNGWWDVVHCLQEKKKKKGDENKETSSSNRRILSSFCNKKKKLIMVV